MKNMINKNIIFIMILFMQFFLLSCWETNGNKGSLIIPSSILKNDSYPFKQRFDEVVIDKQTWMLYNLVITKFRNGDPILHCQSNKEWEDAIKSKTPAWCFYGEFPSPWGLIYNKFAIIDSRCLAPKGYHLPIEKEFVELSNSFEYNWEGIRNKNYNDSLIHETFYKSFLGARDDDGSFFGAGENTIWATNDTKIVNINNTDKSLGSLGEFGSGGGFYIRCLKD